MLQRDAQRLSQELQQARTPDAIVAAVAQAVWHNERNQDGQSACPATAIPTLEGLSEWYDRSSLALDNHLQTVEDIQTVCRRAVQHCESLDSGIHPVRVRNCAVLIEVVLDYLWTSDPGECPRHRKGILGSSPDGPNPRLPVRALHVLWLEHDEGEEPPKHPLVALLGTWLESAHPAEPFWPRQRGNIPRLDRTDQVRGLSRGFPATIPNAPLPSNGQLEFDLAEFKPQLGGCPAWLVHVFRHVGATSGSQGGGASWPLRLLIGAVLHFRIDDRDGHWRTLRLPPPYVASWLHPGGWANRRRDWDNFPEALRAMNRDLSFLQIEGLGEVAMVLATIIPKHLDDPFVEFTLRVQAAAAHGDRLDWPTLCRYGQQSALLYRCYLVAMSILGHSARNGHPITREIGAEVLGPDGRPARRKGGQLIRSETEFVRNPLGRFVGQLTFDNLTLMVGYDPARRYQRKRTRDAFYQLEADGVIEVEETGKAVRLFGPPKGKLIEA